MKVARMMKRSGAALMRRNGKGGGVLMEKPSGEQNRRTVGCDGFLEEEEAQCGEARR